MTKAAACLACGSSTAVGREFPGPERAAVLANRIAEELHTTLAA